MAVVEERGETLLEDGVAHERFLLPAAEPVEVVVLVEAAVHGLRVALLGAEDVVDIVVLGACQLDVPIDESAVHFNPFVGRHAVRELHAYFAELALVVLGAVFALEATEFGVFFDGEEDLAGVDGFGQVVADFAAEGVLHDVFLFALGDHDDGELRPALLDDVEGVEAAQARHLLVEEDEVRDEGFHFVERIAAALDGDDGVAFFFEEEDVWLEQVDFVIGP